VTKVTFRHFSLTEICDENIQSPEISYNEKEYQHSRPHRQVIAAVVIAILYFTHQIEGTAATVLGIAAIIIAATALINFCPLYRLFGISTRKKTAQS
jgi:hypothetical protein